MLTEPEPEPVAMADAWTVTSTEPETPATPTNVPAEAGGEGDAELSDAASRLGRRGGAATAAKRAEAKVGAQDTTDTQDGESGDHEGRGLGKPRHDPQARVIEATRQAAQARRERDAARAEQQRLERELASERSRQAKQNNQPLPLDGPKLADQKPKVEDFESYEDFVEAKARWVAREEFGARQREAAEMAVATEYQRTIGTKVESFGERVSGVKPSHPEYREHFGIFMAGLSPELQDLRTSFQLDPSERVGPLNIIADGIFRSEQAPALLLHFSEHRNEFQRIASLQTPQDILWEMAKLEFRLEAATAGASSRQAVSRAKSPVRPVTGSPHTAPAEPDENSSYDEHVRYHNAKERRGR